MTTLDEEDVIDQLSHGRQAAAGLHWRLEGVSMFEKPAAPFVALAVGIP
jgi:hypothetical protein